MKTIKHIFTILMVISLSACNFVDIPKEDNLPADDVEFTTNDIEGLTSAVYAKTNWLMSSWVMQGMQVVRGDDFWRGRYDADQADLDGIDKYEYAGLETFWGSNTYWNNMFTIITTANSNLRTLNTISETITDSNLKIATKQAYAEMRFCRALAYFWLVNMYEGAPIVTEDMEPTGYNPRTKPEGVFQFIIDEMNVIQGDMLNTLPGKRTDAFVGGATKYSALTLKAKAALYLKDYETVLEATEDICANSGASLYPKFYELFMPIAKMCDESLFELQFGVYGTGSSDIKKTDTWFGFQGPSNQYQSGTDDNGNPVYSTVPIINGWGFIAPEKAFVELLQAETDRLKGTVLDQGDTGYGDIILTRNTSTFQGQYNWKAYTPSNQIEAYGGNPSYGDGNNIRIFRYADVLLMQAEAKIKLGQSGDTEINEVRTRANMPTISGATIDDLLYERQVELAGEWGWRFWDLVRNDKAIEVLGSRGYDGAEDNYLPIHVDLTDNNPILLQDPIDYISAK